MAGGSGERLWPRSSETTPKQFVPLVTEKTILRETADRLLRMIPIADMYVCTRKGFEKQVRESIPEIGKKNIIIEPAGKDTAAAVCLSAIEIEADPDEVLFFTPSDHHIQNIQMFVRNVRDAEKTAKEQKTLVVLGIPPTYPSSGYGYIEMDNVDTRRVKRFVEKPTEMKAKTYIASGRYLWNAGMFFIRQDTARNLFQRHIPRHVRQIERYLTYKNDDYEKAERCFNQVEKISFDYAVAEKEKDIFCIPTSFAWTDIGSWSTLQTVKKTDKHKNLFTKNVRGFDCHNVLCEVDDITKQVVLNGLEDLNIILEGNILYITHKKKEDAIKIILKKLKGWVGK